MSYSRVSISHSWKQLAIVAAIALSFSTACSLGSGANSGVPAFGKGVITAKGSIWVNGVEYNTNSTKITVNDGAGADSDLKVGMVVELKGSADSASGKGTAVEVLYSADVDGPVGAIDLAANTFTVFTRTVAVDASTIWDGVAGIAALVVNDRVEVSGSVDTVNKVLKADRVYKKTTSPASEGYEVKGVVSGLAAASFTLTPPDGAPALTVNFTGSLAPSIVNGSSVEIRFASIAGSTIATSADKIRGESHLSADDKSKGELRGLVSGYVAGPTASFSIDGIQVLADSSLLPPGFGNGVEAEVKGSMSGGVLTASSVRTEKEPNAELRGVVSSVSASLGTLAVNGVTLTVDASTRFRDENGPTPVDHFGLASVQVGDYIEASGTYDASALPVFAAEKVERKAPPSGPVAFLRGPVSAMTSTGLTILGVSVDISAATFKSGSGAVVASAAAFEALIAVGATPVEAKGAFAAGTLTATAAAIDN
jgi:hypothetical protein